MRSLLQDLTYGFRLLRRQPTFAFVAILVLTLGIGINTAAFSVVNTLPSSRGLATSTPSRRRL